MATYFEQIEVFLDIGRAYSSKINSKYVGLGFIILVVMNSYSLIQLISVSAYPIIFYF